MEREEVPERVLRQMDGEQIAIWWRAVEVQGKRALDVQSVTNLDARIEFYLFAIALRQLLRAVNFCRPHEPAAIEAAIATFDSAVPHCVNLRDVIEHFDDYELGIGKLQRQRVLLKVPSDWFEHDGTSTIFHLPPLHLDVAEALAAAEHLADAAMDAVIP